GLDSAVGGASREDGRAETWPFGGFQSGEGGWTVGSCAHEESQGAAGLPSAAWWRAAAARETGRSALGGQRRAAGAGEPAPGTQIGAAVPFFGGRLVVDRAGGRCVVRARGPHVRHQRFSSPLPRPAPR